MDDTLKFALTIAAGILGWLLVHLLTMARDRANKIRDLKTKYLIEAFQKLERNVWNNKPIQGEVESAMADIQLFGQEQEVDLAIKFMRLASTPKAGGYLDLLHLLRHNLRKELNLPASKSALEHWRPRYNEMPEQKPQLGENQS